MMKDSKHSSNASSDNDSWDQLEDFLGIPKEEPRSEPSAGGSVSNEPELTGFGLTGFGETSTDDPASGALHADRGHLESVIPQPSDWSVPEPGGHSDVPPSVETPVASEISAEVSFEGESFEEEAAAVAPPGDFDEDEDDDYVSDMSSSAPPAERDDAYWDALANWNWQDEGESEKTSRPSMTGRPERDRGTSGPSGGGTAGGGAAGTGPAPGGREPREQRHSGRRPEGQTAGAREEPPDRGGRHRPSKTEAPRRGERPPRTESSRHPEPMEERRPAEPRGPVSQRGSLPQSGPLPQSGQGEEKGFGEGLLDSDIADAWSEDERKGVAEEPEAGGVSRDREGAAATGAAATGSAGGRRSDEPVESEGGRKRRRRRRRSRSGDAAGRPVEREAEPGEEEVPDEGFSELVESGEADDTADLDEDVHELAEEFPTAAAESEETQRKSRRRPSRRRRGERPRTTEQEIEPETSEEPHVLDVESEFEPDEFRGAIGEPEDGEEGDEGEEEEDSELEPATDYRDVPTWEEAISYMLNPPHLESGGSSSKAAGPDVASRPQQHRGGRQRPHRGPQGPRN